MTLAEYINELMEGYSIRDVTGPGKSGVSRGALHQIMVGVTTDPAPRTLANLARFFGKTDEEASRIYTEMMALCGYLDLLRLGLETGQGEAPVTELDKAILDAMEFLKQRHSEAYEPIRQILEQQESQSGPRLRGMADPQAS